jgi:hypothetical protein
MKKLTTYQIDKINAGGSRGCDFVSGALAGWGLAGYIVGGAVALSSGGAALILAGVVVGAYCSK